MGCHQGDGCHQKIPRELNGEVRASQDQVPRDSCLSLTVPVVSRSPVFSLLQVDPLAHVLMDGTFSPSGLSRFLEGVGASAPRPWQSCPMVPGSSSFWDSKFKGT